MAPPPGAKCLTRGGSRGCSAAAPAPWAESLREGVGMEEDEEGAFQKEIIEGQVQKVPSRLHRASLARRGVQSM